MWTQADLQTLLHKARLIRLSLRKGWMNRILVAWIVLGVIGVPLIVWNRKQSQEGSRRRDLHYWCLERARLLEDQVVLNKNMAKTFTELILVFGSYNATNSLTDSIFRRFCDETGYAHPMVLSLTYSVYLTQAERPAFESSTGLVVKDILTHQRRSTQIFYLVVLYANTAAMQFIGYDMLSLPENYEAFTTATPVLSGVMTVPYTLILDGNIGTAVFFPVLKRDPGANATRDSVEEALLGEIVCVMDFEVLIGNLLQQLYNPRSNFVFEVYDITDITKPIPLYSVLSRTAKKRGSEIAFTNLNMGHSDSVIPVDFQDSVRRHLAVCRFGDNFSGWSWYSLSWGLLFSVIVLLVGYILRTASKQMAKMEQNCLRMAALKTEAELADKAKSNFLTTVSHEIRTPMNGVLGMLDSLMETKLDGHQLELAKIAHTSGTALVSLINDVLDMAKIQSGHMTLDKVVFYIRMLADETLDLFRPKLREIGLEVAVLVDDDVPDRLEGDAGRLRQVLVNLLGNSIKFTEVGHVLLHISMHEEGTCTTPTPHESDGAFPSGGFSRKGNLRRRSSFGKASKTMEGSETAKQRVINSAKISRITGGEDSLRVAGSTLQRFGCDSLSGCEAADSRNSWGQLLFKDRNSPGSKESYSSLEISPFSIHSHKSGLSPGAGSVGAGSSCSRSSKGPKPSLPLSSRPRNSYTSTLDLSLDTTTDVGEPSEVQVDVEHSQRTVVLSIVCEDTGTGIPEGAELRLFQPFMQADSSISRKYGGTGIGLSISRHIVNMMGGDLKYFSRSGVGATFEFTAKFNLPDDQEEPLEAYKNYGVSPTALAALQGKTILLIDGLPVRRLVTTTVFVRLGICIRTLGDPSVVVDYVAEYYRRHLNMDIPEGHLVSLAEGLHSRRPYHPTAYHAVAETIDLGAHQHASGPTLSTASEDSIVGGGAGSMPKPRETTGHENLHTTSAGGATKMRLNLVIGDGAANERATEHGYAPTPTGTAEPVKCEAILVDIDAFGQNTGLELGRFVKSHKPGDSRYTLKSEVTAERESVDQFPPLLLLACKIEQRDEELWRMGFASKMMKPLKISALVDMLANITATDRQRPAVSRSPTFEKLSAKRALTDLLTGRRFLVVDDNMVNRLVAKRMLERYGAAVVAVDGGQSAINKLKTTCDFDTVFMDIQMPEMDGFEATERIRTLEARGELGVRPAVPTVSNPRGFTRLKIVALTADVFGANRSKCEDSGMDGYITKPLEEEQFHKTMVHILGADSSHSPPHTVNLNPFASTPPSDVAEPTP